jgi:hypothetical protein
MGRVSESARSRARQLELASEKRIGWVELPAQIRNQVRDELKRLLVQLAASAEVEVDDDDAEH